jgi:hypothetical protein
MGCLVDYRTPLDGSRERLLHPRPARFRFVSPFRPWTGLGTRTPPPQHKVSALGCGCLSAGACVRRVVALRAGRVNLKQTATTLTQKKGNLPLRSKKVGG